MPRGKANATIALERAILGIVERRAPITVRGVCYALFTQDLIPNMTTKHTQRVSRVMTAMRETDELDWTLIVDGSRAVERINLWRDPDQIIDAAVKSYRRNRWQDQPTLVEIWSEKSTVQGVLAPVLDEYGVTFRVMKGFGSFTAVRQAAEDSLDIPADKGAIAFYLGDWDPSGLFMSDVDLPRRLQRYGGLWDFQRIAITDQDIGDLPSFDVATKAEDPRHMWYRERYGHQAWELDALDPVTLRKRVAEQIATCISLPAWEHAEEIERAEVASMREFHAAWKDAQHYKHGGGE